MPPIPSNVVRPETTPDEPEPASDAEVEEESEAIFDEAQNNFANNASVVSEESPAADDEGHFAAAPAGEPRADGGSNSTAPAGTAPSLRRSQPKPAQPLEHRRSAARRLDAAGATGPLAIFAAVAAGSWLLWRVLRRIRSRPASAAAASALASAPALVGDLDLLPSPAPAPPAAPQPLAGATFAIADL